jgi:predicted enzyme related to lactoylglutathione lyase
LSAPPPIRSWFGPVDCERLLEVEILNSNPVLAVHDLARSAAWYRDVLGCETREPDPGNWTFCRLGAVDFMLGRCPDAMPASDLGDHSYVAYLRVDDVEAFHDRAVEAGAEITKPLTEEPWGMREFALRSVDGHRFTLGQSTRS